MSKAAVEYGVAEHIAEIRLNRPPVNALSLVMLEELVAALKGAAADENVRAVLLTSAVPGRFSAGLDLHGVSGKSSEQVRALLDLLYVKLSEAQYALGKPSIAVVNGAARGGGMTLAISCDVIVAGESATFGYPEIDLGLVPAIHFMHLPPIAGRHRAFELLFSGRSFGAEEAASLGLVSRIVPAAQLVEEAVKTAQKIAEMSRPVAMFAKECVNRAYESTLAEGVRFERRLFHSTFALEDQKEGMAAFVEKRPPQFRNK
jgi:enoyl-CoA hydratase/carnithine racemase